MFSLTLTLATRLLPAVRGLGVQSIALPGLLRLGLNLLDVLGLGHSSTAKTQEF